MTAKEYLSELHLMKIKIEQLQEQKQMYLDMSISMTVPINTVKVQSNLTIDHMGDNVVKATSIDTDIETAIDAFLVRQREIVKEIQLLQNNKYMQLLFKIYVQGKTLKEAAFEMHMTYQYVRDIHRKALLAFEEMHSDLLCERKPE